MKYLITILACLFFNNFAQGAETRVFTIPLEKSDMISLPKAKFATGELTIFMDIQGEYPEIVLQNILKEASITAIEYSGQIDTKAINQKLEKEIDYWLKKWNLEYKFWYASTDDIITIY